MIQTTLPFDQPVKPVEPMRFPRANRTPETRAEAARAIRPTATARREKVLRFIVSRGVRGATDLEVQEALAMDGNTQRPRRVELVAAGLVKDSGCVRLTPSNRKSVVWIDANIN